MQNVNKNPQGNAFFLEIKISTEHNPDASKENEK